MMCRIKFTTQFNFRLFRLRVRPTYDFQQELLWNREELEVLEPAWLRKEMKSIVSRMAEKYRGGRK